jgi:hypothetical protein
VEAIWFAYEPDLHQYVATSVRTAAVDGGGTLMKKVISIGLGVLLAIVVALPAAADENEGCLASALEELYSVIAGLFTDDLHAEAESSESVPPGEEPNATSGTPAGPGVTAEMTPQIWPGG